MIFSEKLLLELKTYNARGFSYLETNSSILFSSSYDTIGRIGPNISSA
ncbi:uncharacterized protein METZ01_LOCUS181122, partial [marine metagenome]